MVDGGLGVVDVLIDDEGGAASVLVGADSDLADGTVLAEDVVHLFAGDVEWQVADVENSVHLRRQPRVAFSQGDGRHGYAPRRLTVVTVMAMAVVPDSGLSFALDFAKRRNFSLQRE